MKSLLILSAFLSFTAVASTELEIQKNNIERIIAKNQQDINLAIDQLREDQATLRRSSNSITALQRIQNSCADTDFERLITNLKKNWEFDFVKMTTSRLTSSYRMYQNNPELTPNLKISQSEVFKVQEKLNLARNIDICNYGELFDYDESGDFVYALNRAWQNYDATLSFNDIISNNYQKTLGHIVSRAPVKVVGEVSRFGNPRSSYNFGKVYRLITYDKVYSGGYRFSHAEITNPIEIIKKAKRY